MKDLFNKYGINLSQQQLNQFEKYYQLLVSYNEKFNITAITDKQEVYVKHFVDSLLGANNFVDNTLIDIGSGGGFPAIPIKIFNPQLKVTLVEATGKKCEFLNAVITELGLENVKVINARAEDLAKNIEYRENFDYCSARAVARLNTLLEYCLPFVKVGGKFIAYKANVDEEIAESTNALKILGGKIEGIDQFELLDACRKVVKVQKVAKTPPKYPRGQGKERKNPL